MKLGQKFWIDTQGYGRKEILTVASIDADGITCHSTRFHQGTRLPNAALEAYAPHIKYLPTESDYRRAADLAETAIRVTPQGSHVRFEEVKDEQGELAA